MKLRKLELKDAPLMLEWMHDKNVVNDLRADFMSKTLIDCENFIKQSWSDQDNWHVAIVDDSNVYMGTVSLKCIRGVTAEFGITIRKCAMGKGYSNDAMKETLRIAFAEKGMDYVYWCVSPNNKRAVRFYDKNGYERVDYLELQELVQAYTINQMQEYIWYAVKRDEWE